MASGYPRIDKTRCIQHHKSTKTPRNRGIIQRLRGELRIQKDSIIAMADKRLDVQRDEKNRCPAEKAATMFTLIVS